MTTSTSKGSRIRRVIAALALGSATLAGTVALPEPAPASAQGSPDLGWYGSSVFFDGNTYAFANHGDSYFEPGMLMRYQSGYWYDHVFFGHQVTYAVFTPGERIVWQTATLFPVRGEPGAFFEIDHYIKPTQKILVQAPLGSLTIDPLNDFMETNEYNNSQTLTRPIWGPWGR